MKKKIKKRSSTVSHSNPLKSTKKSQKLQRSPTPDDDVSWYDPYDLDSQSWDCKYPPYDPKKMKEGRRRQNLECAETALEYYNKKNRINYELVDALASNAFLIDEIWHHCNFTAKPKMTPNGDEDGDSSTKLFFAELFYSKPFELDVSCCCIIKGTGTGTGTGTGKGKHVGCEHCVRIEHPTHGYLRGGRKYALRSRSLGDY